MNAQHSEKSPVVTAEPYYRHPTHFASSAWRRMLGNVVGIAGEWALSIAEQLTDSPQESADRKVQP